MYCISLWEINKLKLFEEADGQSKVHNTSLRLTTLWETDIEGWEED